MSSPKASKLVQFQVKITVGLQNTLKPPTYTKSKVPFKDLASQSFLHFLYCIRVPPSKLLATSRGLAQDISSLQRLTAPNTVEDSRFTTPTFTHLVALSTLYEAPLSPTNPLTFRDNLPARFCLLHLLSGFGIPLLRVAFQGLRENLNFLLCQRADTSTNY